MLDNAPFAPVIDALQQRPVDAPFDRVLLYVVPSASARKIATLGDEELPDVGKVLQALVSTVREPDQRLDVELLAGAFEQMSYQNTTTHAVLAGVLTGAASAPRDLAKAADALFDTYRVGRAEAVHRWLTGVGRPVDLTRPRTVDVAPSRIPVVPRPREKDAPLQAGTPWQWGTSSAERVLRWLGRALVRLASDPKLAAAGGDPQLLEQAFDTLGRSQRWVTEVMGEIEESLDARLQGLDDFDARLTELEQILAGYDEGDPVGTAVREAANDVAAWLSSAQHAVDGESIIATALQIEVISSVFAWGGDEGDVPIFTYLQTSPAARSLIEVPPLTKSPGVEGYDDQNQQWAAKKLYGERWGHFGAFATQRGRQHDWLWGRLDGASTLVHLLLGPAADDSPLTTALVDAILAAEGSSRPQVAEGAQHVRDLTDNGLYKEMAAEEKGEDRRELLLATLPEVLGEAKSFPAPVEEIAHVLATGGEALADIVEFRTATKSWLRGLVRRAWRRRPWNR